MTVPRPSRPVSEDRQPSRRMLARRRHSESDIAAQGPRRDAVRERALRLAFRARLPAVPPPAAREEDDAPGPEWPYLPGLLSLRSRAIGRHGPSEGNGVIGPWGPQAAYRPGAAQVALYASAFPFSPAAASGDVPARLDHGHTILPPPPPGPIGPTATATEPREGSQSQSPRAFQTVLSALPPSMRVGLHPRVIQAMANRPITPMRSEPAGRPPMTEEEELELWEDYILNPPPPQMGYLGWAHAGPVNDAAAAGNAPQAHDLPAVPASVLHRRGPSSMSDDILPFPSDQDSDDMIKSFLEALPPRPLLHWDFGMNETDGLGSSAAADIYSNDWDTALPAQAEHIDEASDRGFEDLLALLDNNDQDRGRDEPHYNETHHDESSHDESTCQNGWPIGARRPLARSFEAVAPRVRPELQVNQSGFSTPSPTPPRSRCSSPDNVMVFHISP